MDIYYYNVISLISLCPLRHGDGSIVFPSALRYASGTLEPSPWLR